MKKILFAISAATLAFVMTGCSSSVSSLDSDEDSLSYAFGVYNGQGILENILDGEASGAKYETFMKGIETAADMPDSLLQIYLQALQFGGALKHMEQDTVMPLNSNTFIAAMKAEIKGKETLIDADTAQEVIQSIQQRIEEQNALKNHAQNKLDGENFLKQNAKKASVKVTPSGLQYEVIKQGKGGAKPSDNDIVSVNYVGTLTDGTVFDDSKRHGDTPAKFPVAGVVRGFAEGLQLMSVGDKYKFYIPQELAYGVRGAGEDIKPFSALIFEVELVSIEPKAAAPVPQFAE